MLCPYCLAEAEFELTSKVASGLSDEDPADAKLPNPSAGSGPGPVRYRCPQCRSTVPTMYVKDYDEYPPVVTSAVGFSGHGKTVYFASLFHALRNEGLTEQWPEFYSLALDDPSLKTVLENMAMLDEGSVPSASPKNFQRPTLLRLACVPGLGNCTLAIYDISGEAFKEGVQVEQYARFVARAQTAMFMISIPELLKEGRDYATALERLLTAYLIGLRELGGDPAEQDLVVVYTKADILAKHLDGWQTIRGYVAADPYDGLADTYQYLNQLGAMSALLAKFTVKAVRAVGFYTAATHNFRSVRFCMISSLGAEPGPDGKLRVKISPRRVLDPLLMLVAMQMRARGSGGRRRRTGGVESPMAKLRQWLARIFE